MPPSLSELDPTLADAAALSVESEVAEYTVSVESPNTGNAFELSRSADGAVSYSCTAPGNAGCPSSGDWSQ